MPAKPDVTGILSGAAEALNAVSRLASHGAQRDGARATVKESYEAGHTWSKVVPLLKNIGDRITAIEMQRAQQQQPQPIAPVQQPARVADAKPPCVCQPASTPQRTKDGVNVMSGLAPRNHITFDAAPRPTRDQTRVGEQPAVSRFDSVESDRLAKHVPRGSAGPITAAEINDANRRAWAKDDSQGMLNLGQLARQGRAPANTPYELNGADGRRQHGESGTNERGDLGMAYSNDPSEAFANALSAVPPGQPVTAQNILNRHYNAAKDGPTRDKIEKVWKDFSSAYDAHGDKSQWAPRQEMQSPSMPSKDTTGDASWSNLYAQNASTIGSDPNKIMPGMRLDVGNGQTHEVQAGENLSKIASMYGGGGSSSGGGSSVPVPPVRPAGLGESYGQGQEPGESSSRNVEKMLGSSSESTTGSSSGSGSTPAPSGILYLPNALTRSAAARKALAAAVATTQRTRTKARASRF
jgi:LysM repeat protein